MPRTSPGLGTKPGGVAHGTGQAKRMLDALLEKGTGRPSYG
jgi:hypothetical protein